MHKHSGWEVAGQLAGEFADDIVFVGRYAMMLRVLLVV